MQRLKKSKTKNTSLDEQIKHPSLSTANPLLLNGRASEAHTRYKQ